ncbi:hypothetical protein PG988_015980 [Apiospora saccharicola]
MKQLTLETGGKSPLIVYEDANLDLATQWALLGFTYNQGELCTTTTRLLVQDSVYDRFIETLTTTTKKYAVGQLFDEETYLGPLVGKAHYDRVLEYMALGKEGARDILNGGAKTEAFPKGYFVTLPLRRREAGNAHLPGGNLRPLRRRGINWLPTCINSLGTRRAQIHALFLRACGSKTGCLLGGTSPHFSISLPDSRYI